MNADQAKQITKEARKSLDELYSTIEMMAKAGHDYATLQVNSVREPEEYKTKLESEGFNVNITETYFLIDWKPLKK